MTQPRVQNIELTRGDDYFATFTFDQPVSGFSEMRFTVRESWATTEEDNDEATLTLALAASGSATADLDISSEQSLALALDSYVYDLQITTNAGKKYTTQRGFIRITPDTGRS
jgi:hypothetical protein